MRDGGPAGDAAPAADVAAVAALEPPPTSVRDAKTRLRWGTERAAAALRAWREQRSSGVPDPDPVPPAVSAGSWGAGPPAALEEGQGAAAGGGPMLAALEEALEAGGHGPEHAATVALARRYAAQLDAGDPDELGKLGRALLSVLVELRLTPRTRTALVPLPTPPGDPHADESGDDERGSELERFRARRDRRAYGAPAVDPTTS